MNRQQSIAGAIAAANLLLLLMFPPFDYVALQRGNIPTFDGFYFLLGEHINLTINRDFLTLEILVVLINAGISWFLLRDKTADFRRDGNRYQRGVLWLVAVNLLLMLLFPPFEYYYAITPASLPTFDGFYFVFGDNSQRQIVAPVLYIEIVLLLVNGALLWLLFEERGDKAALLERRSVMRMRDGHSTISHDDDED
jgi:hypothetical protein